MKKEISRRDFLRGAAAGAAGLAAMGVLGGCSNNASASTTGSAETGSETIPDTTTVAPETTAVSEPATTAAAALSNQDTVSGARYAKDYENTASIGIVSEQVTSEENADIVVVGSGIAGFMAAMIAKEQAPDLNIILLEKNGLYGGSTRLAECNGPAANATEEAARASAARHASGTGYIADPMLMYHMKLEAGSNASWLFGKHKVGYTQGGGPAFYEGGNGSIPVDKNLTPDCEALGVDMRLNNRAKALLLNDDHTCTGIQVYNPDGELYNIRCKAVILCTGGMSTNQKLLSYYANQDMEKIIPWGLGQDGDGHIMAEQTAHGRATHLTVSSLFNNVQGFAYDSALGCCATMQYTNVWVNQDGVRFMDESGGGSLGTSESGKVIECQGHVYSIMDQTHIDNYARGGATRHYSGFADLIAGAETPAIYDELKEYASNPNVYTSDTLEGLATAIGVDSAVFTATIDTYNKSCETGTDSEWGKDAKYLWPVVQGPFYAFRVSSGMLNTNGGIRINTNAQVVDARYNPVTGLYAAGVCTSGWDGEVYGGGTCQTVGMWAGSKAARHALATIFGKTVAGDWYGELMEVASGGPGGGPAPEGGSEGAPQ
ncbi:MAG: FAD-binding protein [Lachnospiraceae bacterium]|jgi:fumarate reductase flavoprotein subunit|nr:FAD-binding protein [Lachnospiraceae bacterium]